MGFSPLAFDFDPYCRFGKGTTNLESFVSISSAECYGARSSLRMGWIVRSTYVSLSPQKSDRSRYFNATAQIELIPVVGWKTLNDSLCPSLRGKTFTASFPSVLAITERGPYNVGTNPVNMYLTFWDPGFNFSTLGGSFPAGITGIGDLMYTSNPSLAGTLESSP